MAEKKNHQNYWEHGGSPLHFKIFADFCCAQRNTGNFMGTFWMWLHRKPVFAQSQGFCKNNVPV